MKAGDYWLVDKAISYELHCVRVPFPLSVGVRVQCYGNAMQISCCLRNEEEAHTIILVYL